MRRALSHGIATLVLIAACAPMLGSPARSYALTAQEVVTAEKLKTEAFQALRGGHFDRTNELLLQAASITHDPTVERMAGWTSNFESQRQEFVSQRHKQYDKLAGQIQMLLKKSKPDYAMDLLREEYLLADDKKAFRAEPWVDDLVKGSIKRAEQYDQTEQWVKALRLYADLGSVEPAVPSWKDRLKLATRRVRLLALYTPDALKNLQDSDGKEREEVDRLLNPETPPRKTDPNADNDAFRIDWRETLRGIDMDMLKEGLAHAEHFYYRDASYKDMALGGLKGLQAVMTTKGLEKTFPKLADPSRKRAFVAALDECISANRDAVAKRQETVLSRTLDKLEAVNHQTVQLPDSVLVSEFADGAFAELDQFTSMIWPSDVEEFNKATQGEFSGVGIQIQLDDDASLKVASPLEDTPAYKAGIKAGDTITHINGKNAKGITLNQAVKTITGPSGTMVTLTVRGADGKTRDYPIRRETIKVASVKGWLHRPGGGWEYFVDPQQKIGYMRMTNFTKETSKELDRAVDTLRENGARALILDLRYNPGGLLTSATEVADKFLRSGVIVSTRPDRDTGNMPDVHVAKADEGDTDLPLVVLVNQYSASASEIVSGALKDQKRAIVVGERTFGKGSVQMLYPLSGKSAYLKLTTSHYYLPSGRCIHREENSQEWGVEPDYKVEMTPEQMKAAIESRQELDVLRDAHSPPAEGQQPKLKDKAEGASNAVVKKTEKKDPLTSDPQLSAAVLLLRLRLSGAEL